MKHPRDGGENLAKNQNKKKAKHHLHIRSCKSRTNTQVQELNELFAVSQRLDSQFGAGWKK